MTTDNDQPNEERSDDDSPTPSPEAMEFLRRVDPDLADRVKAIGDRTCHDHSDEDEPTSRSSIDRRLELQESVLEKLKEMRAIANLTEDENRAMTFPERMKVDRLSGEIMAMTIEIRQINEERDLDMVDVIRKAKFHTPTAGQEIPMNVEISELFDIVRDFAQRTPFTHEPAFRAHRWNITCVICRQQALDVEPLEIEKVPHTDRCPWDRSRRISGRSVSMKAVEKPPESKPWSSSHCTDSGCSWSADGPTTEVLKLAANHQIAQGHDTLTNSEE